ncbi:substrate-binding domain-containing protein [Nakamurella lactea]|uniref:substrate-binding domain-containing protein n=1 Tax=Nakamurella lactea TaxID=459515 RepID=UPI0003F92CAB|nr:substrate-binding domain-containing protein [Nakamurella lactea]
MQRKKLAILGAVAAATALVLSACSTNADSGSSTPPAATSAADTAAATSEAATSEAATSAADTAGAESSAADTAGSESSAADTAGSADASASGAAGGPMTSVDLPKKDKYVIGYSQSNNAEPYRAQLNKQLQYYVAQHPELELLPISDAAQDSSKQVSQVQQFISQKVDILIVSPNEADPLTPPVEQACKAGIKVIILDRTVNTDCITAFIGGDNVAAGKAAGELAAKLLPDGGNVAELQGILSNQPQIDRNQGFADGISSNPKIKIVEHQEAKWLKEDATKIMQQWLQGGTKIDLVYAQNDPMALGAYLAAAGAGKQKEIKFIGTDGLAIPDGGIRAVQQGQLAGTFIYPTGAAEAVDTIMKMVGGEEFSAKQVLPVTAVTPENADELYKKYDFSNK